MRSRIHGWRSIGAAVAVAAALVTTAVPALAITDGAPDGSGHPYVGLMVAQDAAGQPLWRCTGTLMSSTGFMTAGHCTEAPAAHIEIWFAAGPIPLAAGYPAVGADRCAGIVGYPCTGDVGGTPYGHPQYDPNAFYTHDLGFVVLDDSMPMGTYGALPTLNQLDTLKPGRSTTFTAVGYGLQMSFPDAAGWKDQATRVRLVAHPWLVQINRGIVAHDSLLLSNNAKSGGTCFGDSGGPNFLGTSNVVAGVTSFGLNPTCGGTGGVYRVDTADDLNWLAHFGL
ncbi:MAG: trypsin-like serine protease [Candidatus Limnocylindrales bacterium]